jgi:hypothetical protein
MQIHLTTAIHRSSDFRISGCRAYTPSKMIWKKERTILKKSQIT